MAATKVVPDTEGRYYVTDDGHVYNASKEKPVIGSIGANGYRYVRLSFGLARYARSVLVHRVVALAFVPGYREGLTVDHIDGCKDNNAASNLRWLSRSDNARKGNLA